MQSSNSMYYCLTAGILEIKGNFTQKRGYLYNFISRGTKVILSGSGTQTVTFDTPGDSYFNILDIENPNGISFASAVSLSALIGNGKINTSLTLLNIVTPLTNDLNINGDFTFNGGTLNLGGQTINVSGNLIVNGGDIDLNSGILNVNCITQNAGNIKLNCGTLNVAGSVTLNDGTMDLSYGIMTVSGSLTQSDGSIDLNYGELDVTNNITQTGGTINIDNGEMTSGNDYSVQGNSQLLMQNDCDYIFVNGNFNIGTSMDERGSLSNGVLEVKGDFTQGGNCYAFAASDSHEVVLSGNRVQTVSFQDSKISHFNKVNSSRNDVNYTAVVNFDVSNLISEFSLPVQIAIAAFKELTKVDITALIGGIFNAIINKLGLQYITSAEIGYFIGGLVASFDANMLWGLGTIIAGFFDDKIDFMEDQYYFMLAKTFADKLFFLYFANEAKIAIEVAMASAGVGAGSAAAAAATAPTGVGLLGFGFAAAAALDISLDATVVAVGASIDSAHSGLVLFNDSDKFSKITKGMGEAFKFSKNQIKHILDHTVEKFRYQVPNKTDIQLEATLAKDTFFNPNWSEEKVLDSVKNSYLDARAKGLIGARKYTIDGDDIILFIKEDGTLDSAYGTYKFTKDYFGR